MAMSRSRASASVTSRSPIRIRPSLTVSNPADENDGIYSVGNLSLREAIELTNLNPLPDTIIFDPAVVADNPVFFLGGVFKPGTSADMKITDDLTITGPGLAVLALDAGALERRQATAVAASNPTPSNRLASAAGFAALNR